MQAIYRKYILDFKRPGGTSRGVLTQKETWFIILKDNGHFGIGECGLFRGLSADDVEDYEEKLQEVCLSIALGKETLLKALRSYPSIQFGLEQAFRSLNSPKPFQLFSSAFLDGKKPIPINGLIWMGDEAFMKTQIEEKLQDGFNCLKLKIGALEFEREFSLLKSLRKQYSQENLELRVDANGAFAPDEALLKLERLAELELHSIEQPIKAGNILEMSSLCSETPLAVALDEELIGIYDVTEKEKLLQTIQPQYIILKPSLIGGFAASQEWITLAEKLGIGWWITSALESNIGLNAIAQWTATLEVDCHQGLGTGGLFSNNFNSPLEVDQGYLRHNPSLNWEENLIEQLCI